MRSAAMIAVRNQCCVGIPAADLNRDRRAAVPAVPPAGPPRALAKYRIQSGARHVRCSVQLVLAWPGNAERFVGSGDRLSGAAWRTRNKEGRAKFGAMYHRRRSAAAQQQKRHGIT